MNNIQKEYVMNLVSKGTRADNRKIDEFRKIEIEKNPIENAEGSARIRIGKTDVLVGIKIDTGTPFQDRPDEGILMTGAEFSPLAHRDFESGPPRVDAIELARVVDRGIRESGALDVKKLCIKKGEKVWMVFVDISIINHDGNLMDAASIAATAALWNSKMPVYDKKNDVVEYSKKTSTAVPIKFKPIAVTFAKVGDKLLVDPSIEEEKIMSTRLTVATKDNGNLCALQKGGFGALSVDEIKKVFDISVKQGKEIRKLIK
jgi:exosome complex component RRP42